MDLECSVCVVASVIAGLFFVYMLGTWSYDFFEVRNIPFVKPLPFVGNLGPFLMRKRSYPDILVDLYTRFKGLRVAGYYELMSPVTMILDPEIIRMITVKDFDHFTDHKLPIREDADPLFGKNLFALQGERWRDMRHTLSPAFTSSKMKAMFLLVREIGIKLGDHLEKRCQAAQDGVLTLEMKDLFTRYGNDVIATSAFGLHCDSFDEPDNEFFRVGKDVTNFGGRVGIIAMGFHFSSRLMKMLNMKFISDSSGNFFRSLVHGTIETREKENIVRPDMIHLLMQAKKGKLRHDVTDEIEPSVVGAKKIDLTDDDQTAQALLFLIAGFDTSTTLMSYMSHLLAVHPDVQRRVQQEVDEVLQGNDGVLSYEKMQRMTYLDMVISETLRLYPPSPMIERLCTKSFSVEATDTSPAVVIHKGEGINMPIYAMHRDPEYFPDPLRFDPERFSKENEHNIKPFTYMPFGVGPRACIGMRFALMETKIAVTCLMSRFNLEVVAKTSIPLLPSRVQLNLNADDGYWVGIRPRTKTDK